MDEERKYRYLLWRVWDMPLTGDNEVLRMQLTSMCAFVGLNPSTADETEDDPTIRRCMGFARRWGYDGMWMLNLFAWRATDPRALKKVGTHAKTEGPLNLDYSKVICRNAPRVVLAWGAHGAWGDAGYTWHDVLNLVRMHAAYSPESFMCFKVLANEEPGHPLYLPNATELIEFPGYQER